MTFIVLKIARLFISYSLC